MIRLLPATAIALWAALGCSGGVEIPTVEVGSGGARLMNGQSKTPAEAYDKAYTLLGRAHYNVRRNLETRSQNQLGAREAMAQIIRCLEAMRACIPDPDQPRLDPYLSRYGGWLKDLENGTWGGSFLDEFDRSEREIKSKFSPNDTRVLAEFPNARPAPPKTGETALTPDKVEVPAAKKPSDSEQAAPKVEPPPPSPAVTARIFYKAWSAAHDDLIASYKEKKPCKAKYEDVVESLRLLKAQLPAERAAKLQIYIDYYSGIDEKTRSFTALPEKTAEKDIVDELDVAARVLRKEFNPDK